MLTTRSSSHNLLIPDWDLQAAKTEWAWKNKWSATGHKTMLCIQPYYVREKFPTGHPQNIYQNLKEHLGTNNPF